jgi:hypothetical protein
MRTTVDIAEPLLDNAKRRAAERGVTLSVVLEDALRQHLATRPNVEAPPFKLITFRSELVDPNINLDRTSELITRDDEEEYGKAGQ